MPSTDFDTSHLTGEARRIADAIVAFITEDQQGEAPSGGGCTAFYSPEAWKERGEEYGLESTLILVHDGGDLTTYVNYDYGAFKSIGRFDAMLDKLGYYAEPCTGWYAAVVPKNPPVREPEPVPVVNDEAVARLTGDLQAARAAAIEAIKNMKDGGTCCLDTVKVRSLPTGATTADLAAAASASGVSAFGLSLGPPTGAQGHPRTKACEVMSAALNAAGWATDVHYVMD